MKKLPREASGIPAKSLFWFIKYELRIIDVLIDDYTKNIERFLEKSKGKAILYDQPWNRDHSAIDKYIQKGRLKVVNSWSDISKTIEDLYSQNRVK